MGWVPDLDGAVIAYVIEADRLVDGDRFRIDLSLEETARALRINPTLIADPRCSGEVDPDAELFRAQLGVLTERSRELSRKYRRRQVLEGSPPDGVRDEWVITTYSFTLNRLRHPSAKAAEVLSAIVRAARGIMPRPGDKFRAVGCTRGALDDGHVAVTIGMLPPSVPVTDPRELDEGP
jgi:hypothetical protein